MLGLSDLWAHLAAYPAACFVLRLLCGWLWPWLQPVLALPTVPALWLLRAMLWQPVWWRSAPVCAACYWAMGRAVQLQDSPEPAAVPAFLWRDALMLSSSW